ncbi:MAG: hypothetical protein QHC81_05090, partial [Achromobacter sp.]|nr:hypothetical protein [Achromobacter sp.]
ATLSPSLSQTFSTPSPESLAAFLAKAAQHFPDLNIANPGQLRLDLGMGSLVEEVGFEPT